MIENRQEYSLVVNSGQRCGRVNGLALSRLIRVFQISGGIMLPVEALVTTSLSSGGKVYQPVVCQTLLMRALLSWCCD